MKIAVIGCGVIGSALARHFALNHDVLLADHTFAKSQALAQEIGGIAYEKAEEAIAQAEMVVLAFKPKDLTAFAQQSQKAFKPGVMLVSVLAGTPVTLLQTLFPAALVIRAMPNLPMICGEGIIGFVKSRDITPEKKKKIEEVFQGLGLLPWLSEDHLESLSALAGSGPGFVFLLIQGMIDSGVALGFTPEEAREYVLQTMEGSVALLKSTGKSPEELKTNVASPGGTTMEGLKVLEESGIRDILKKTYQATFLKAKKLQK